MATDTAALYETKAEGLESPGSFTKMWQDALARATDEEKDWRKKAEEAIEVYRGTKKSGRSFNILHSNIETICPALYNSTPAPDVRRRYADADPVGKVAADIIERSLSFTIDNYDFDSLMDMVIRDGELAGRGVPRVRYVPTFGQPIVGQDGQAAVDGNGEALREVTYESVQCDYVPWRYFRRGPGRQWKDVPWVAFGDFLAKEEVAKLNSQLADVIQYDYGTGKDDRKPGSEEQSIFKRALIWQIWDKESRRVISICENYSDAPIAVAPDPLGLSDFFPVPRPYQPVLTTDSLAPVVPYGIYEDLVEELNEITRRITRMVRQLRPRALYGGTDATDIAKWSEADDGELVPVTNAMQFESGMQNALAWFPLDPTTKALQALLVQREKVKETIYEVTGLSDILRGSTQASETATAQQIKSQWGSLRVQRRQAEVARVIRDLFRMKAEIICGKFSWQTLSQMTGIQVPPAQVRDGARAQVQQFMQMAQQAQQQGQQLPVPPNGEQIKKLADSPSQEEVEQILRSDILRAYRIDVESDSTIRGDLTRNQQTMAMFLQGTAQFVQAMGPIVQQAPQALGAVMEIYSAFARQFRLGKQAEDALDSLADLVRQGGGTQQKSDPKADAANIKAQAEIAKAKTEQQTAVMDAQSRQTEHAMDMQKMQYQGALDQQEFQRKAALHAMHQDPVQQQMAAQYMQQFQPQTFRGQ